MKDIYIPFMDVTGNIFTLDANIIAHPSVTCTSHCNNGTTRFIEFLKGLDADDCSFYQPIRKNKTDFSQQKTESNLRDSNKKR